MFAIPFAVPNFKIKQEGNNRFIFDFIRKKYVMLTPEEWVRQNILVHLCEALHYPKGLISVEKEIKVNHLKKRYDIVVYNKQQQPWMLVECKEPGTIINDTTLQQLLRYHNVLQCPYWMLTNGQQNFCAEVSGGTVSWLSSLPV